MARPGAERDDDFVRLSLAYRPPLDWPAMLQVLRRDAVRGIDAVDGDCYQSAVRVDGYAGAIVARDAASGAAGMPKTFSYDLWLDDQSRLTKMAMDMGSAGSMTMEMSGWGQDVSIEAPPAAFDGTSRIPSSSTCSSPIRRSRPSSSSRSASISPATSATRSGDALAASTALLAQAR